MAKALTVRPPPKPPASSSLSTAPPGALVDGRDGVRGDGDGGRKRGHSRPLTKVESDEGNANGENGATAAAASMDESEEDEESGKKNPTRTRTTRTEASRGEEDDTWFEQVESIAGDASAPDLQRRLAKTLLGWRRGAAARTIR